MHITHFTFLVELSLVNSITLWVLKLISKFFFLQFNYVNHFMMLVVFLERVPMLVVVPFYQAYSWALKFTAIDLELQSIYLMIAVSFDIDEQALKHRSSILDGDLGSIGPICRLRRKSSFQRINYLINWEVPYHFHEWTSELCSIDSKALYIRFI
jgi:hypothetical protein